jgi:diaminohydroxyphosphoribosylaminopyrimidine deaminase/5-amino-6-(5-phosphoribosylamino)uracil reductase
MERARELASGSRLLSPPNPWVGAVILDATTGAIIAEGRTQAPGGNHAEIEALTQAGDAARGATLVVTLEPCSHTGRTGPCVEAIIDAGIARVVVAVSDPDPHVAGRGLARLREASDVSRRLDARAERRPRPDVMRHWMCCTLCAQAGANLYGGCSDARDDD